MIVENYIRTIPNYPATGINFYDLNSLFASPYWPKCTPILVKAIKDNYVNENPTHIVGIESRGFVVGASLAQAMHLPFVMVRKSGAKYPGKLLQESYELEYGVDTIVLQQGILGHTSRVIIADDLVATGGTVSATKKLVEQTGAKVLSCATIINLKYLNKFKDIEVVSLYEPTK